MTRSRFCAAALLASVVAIYAVFAGSFARAETAPAPAEPPAARLPQTVVPAHYRLHLDIDPRKDTFSGIAEIDVEIKEPTAAFWMHGLDLTVSEAKARLEDGREISLAYHQATPFGVARLIATAPLPAGKATLRFVYTAPFNTNLVGLYKVRQGDDAYTYTQFEPTEARRAFPSFDQPSFKVPFDISLTVPEEDVAVTNTPLKSQQAEGEHDTRLTFATTRPLPTYLIAFAVGPFDVVEADQIPATNRRPNPIPLRGITTRGKGDQIRFALAETGNIVRALEDYFDIPYPYAKLDLIAVPDFGAGAMENAGAITFREQLILVGPESPVEQLRNFYYVDAHELSHQWFGDLVTPVWWDDIWLNESFATWCGYTILDKMFPDRGYRTQLHDSASGIMRLDSLATARQIREPIKRHEDIGSAFNGITYQKGGGVLLMFESFVGGDNFRNGIRHYLKAHAFQNATAEDFIAAIADANPQLNGQDLKSAFSDYIEKPGVPVVANDLQCTDEGASVKLAQQRYLPVGSAGSTDQTWHIPACLGLARDDKTTTQCIILKQREQSVRLDAGACPDRIMPNANGAGYYRWSLPPEQWASLLQSFDGLNVLEQISVANSLSGTLNAGSISVDDYLSLIPALAASPSWRVALAPGRDLRKLLEYVAGPDQKPALQSRLIAWYRPRLNALNALKSLGPEQKEFRANLVSLLAFDAEDAGLRADLTKTAAAYAGYGTDQELHPDAADPDLLNSALHVGVDELGKPFADLLWAHFLKSDNALTRQYLLSALAWSTDPSVGQFIRGKILSPELKDNEINYVLGGQSWRLENRNAIWDWTRANLQGLLSRVSGYRRGGVVGYFSGFCSAGKADEIEQTFAPIINSLEGGPRSLANTLETIHLCSTFVEFHKK